jgi:hypothetical protein
MDVQAASGHRDQEYQDKTGGKNGHGAHQSGRGESHGSGDVAISGNPQVDPTLQHPRCDSFIQGESPNKCYWAEMRAYTVSLLRRGGSGGHPGQRLLFRLPAQAHR